MSFDHVLSFVGPRPLIGLSMLLLQYTRFLGNCYSTMRYCSFWCIKRLDCYIINMFGVELLLSYCKTIKFFFFSPVILVFRYQAVFMLPDQPTEILFQSENPRPCKGPGCEHNDISAPTGGGLVVGRAGRVTKDTPAQIDNFAGDHSAGAGDHSAGALTFK